MEYLNFDLTLRRCESGYLIQVQTPDGKQAGENFSNPFSEQELTDFWNNIGDLSRQTRKPQGANLSNIRETSLKRAKDIGGRLFAEVFYGTALECLRSSLDYVNNDKGQNKGLRIRLNLTSVPELAKLPWEYLYYPPGNNFFSLLRGAAIVRFLDLMDPIPLFSVPQPLRILVMIGGHKGLNVKRELKKLRDGLGKITSIELDLMDEATLEALRQKLLHGTFHVFHFIGHGGFDSEQGGGQLLFADSKGQSMPVSGEEIGVMLHEHRTLRLVILNACEGSVTAHDNSFSGVAQSLIQHRVPAVIAMQREITDKAAIDFSKGFYEAIVLGHPVEFAMAEARKAIFAQKNYVEWGTPTLYSRSPNGLIFSPPTNLQHGICRPLQPPGAAFDSYWYIGREEEEAIAMNNLNIPGAPVMIWGPRRFGKTWLFKYVISQLRKNDEESLKIVEIDLKSLSQETLSSIDGLLHHLGEQIIEELQGPNHQSLVTDIWKGPGTPSTKLNRLMENHILPGVKERLILAIDRADAVWGSPPQGDFYNLLHGWSDSTDELWSRLRLLLTGSTTPTLLTDGVNASLFSKIPPIRLSDLNDNQIRELAERYDLKYNQTDIDCLFSKVGGHPFLVRLVMHAAGLRNKTISEILDPRQFDQIGLTQYLEEIRQWLAGNKLIDVMRNVLINPNDYLDPDVEERLFKAGLIEWQENGYRIRYSIYEAYLKRKLHVN